MAEKYEIRVPLTKYALTRNIYEVTYREVDKDGETGQYLEQVAAQDEESALDVLMANRPYISAEDILDINLMEESVLICAKDIVDELRALVNRMTDGTDSNAVRYHAAEQLGISIIGIEE